LLERSGVGLDELLGAKLRNCGRRIDGRQELLTHLLNRVCLFGDNHDERQADCLAHLSYELISRLGTLAGVGTIVELHSADHGKIAGAANNEIKVFGCDAIKRTLTGGLGEPTLDLGQIREANLAKNPVLGAHGLIKDAEERPLRSGEQELGGIVRIADGSAPRTLSFACNSSDYNEQRKYNQHN
jgi:hypothetical protein